MGYTIGSWRTRYAERSDLSTKLTHLTRATDEKSSIQVLFEILSQKKLIGSSTASGFIVGSTKAVCLQDAPPHAVAQNCWFEEKWRKTNPGAKKRYVATGLMFSKKKVYEAGGRPVIYDSTAAAKVYLPSNQHWRIVNFDLSKSDNIIDWSHEREWRIPGDFEFELSHVTLLFIKRSSLKNFITLCDKSGEDFYKQVGGIITMDSVLF